MLRPGAYYAFPFLNQACCFSSMASGSTASTRARTLEVIVVAGTKLKNMALVGTQGTFVELIHGGSKYRTNMCKVKGANAAFHDKFMIELIQGLHHIKVAVYNRIASNTDDFIGKGKISLDEVLQRGCQDTICYLKNKSLSAGEIRLIMMYPNAQSSYEEVRAAKEKAENDLISYKNSATGTTKPEQDKTSELDLRNMKVKMAEKEKELTALREELATLKKEFEPGRGICQLEHVTSPRLIVYELAMKQLYNDLNDVRAKLDHSCRGCIVPPTEE